MIIFEMQFGRAPKFWGTGLGGRVGAQSLGFGGFFRQPATSVRLRPFIEMLLNYTAACDRDRAAARVLQITAATNLDRNQSHRFIKPNFAPIEPAPGEGVSEQQQSRRELENKMSLLRRDILKAGAAFSASAVIPSNLWAQSDFAPRPENWKTFQITAKLEIIKAGGSTQAWVPLPSVNEKDWFRTIGSEWNTNGVAERVREQKYGAEILYVQWGDGEPTPVVEVKSRISVRDRATDLSKPREIPELAAAERRLYLEGTSLIPIDGIVKQTSDRIVAGTQTDIEKARAIYEWIVENTFRDAATRGCGTGNIAVMLRSGYLGGKCADLNALFVGLARAAGIPARDIYGIRVAPSRFGYKSLGTGSEVITKAQHCRAEVFLAGFGWVPIDPADVRKVVLEEPPTNLAMNDPKVVAARKALFGSWETNWLAYNFAHDITLPGTGGPRIGFLMYPQAETGGTRLDCLDADGFKYTIISKELTTA